MKNVQFEDFKKLDIRIGTITEVKDFPEANNPAYQLKVDLGEKIGTKNSSAQITDLYAKEDLINKQVIVVVNFPSKQIGPFISECLITGFYSKGKSVVLAVPDMKISNGLRLA